MKKDIPYKLTPDEALRLAERYFEAETTEAEEALLKRFAASEAGASPRFDELRAVLGVAAYARKSVGTALMQRSRRARPQFRRPEKIIRWAAAAAITGIFALTGVSTYTYRQNNLCVAYVSGERVTDTDQVVEIMHQTLNDVDAPTGDPTVEEQLNDMFRTIE